MTRPRYPRRRAELMRVAFVIGEFPKPSETFILRQIVGLLDRGCDLEIFARRPVEARVVDDVVVQRELLARTHYRREGPSPRSSPVAALRSLFGARSGTRSFDVVHAHFGPYGLYALEEREAGALCGPLVTSFHGHDVHRVPRQRGRGVYAPLFAAGQRFTANTRFTADAIVRLGCPPDRLELLPMGIVLPPVPVLPRPVASPRRILTIARHVEKKGLEYGIRAIAALARRHPGLVYDLAGDGPLRGRLERLAAELGITGRVRFLGWCSQARAQSLLRAADVFVLPSVTAKDGDMEGQALVLQEAQALGVPVVSTLHNGIPEGLVPGDTGLLVPERDSAALADAIDRILRDDELRARMGERAVAFVRGRYDIEVLNDRLLQLYRDLGDRTVPPDRRSR
ncbi:MAG TPA: glycosyltransferase [Nannocystaceae bacterium]|nr:glycosyltransferase [Nannocystaceae bacterium]